MVSIGETPFDVIVVTIRVSATTVTITPPMMLMAMYSNRALDWFTMIDLE